MKFQLSFFHLFLLPGILLLFCAEMAFGQEKATPSPTPIPAQSDTTAADSLAGVAGTDSDKPEMELPEVLILGETRSVRVRESKEQRVPDNPQLVKPDVPAETIDTWFQLQEEKPELENPAAGLNQLTWGGLRGGSFSTFNGILGHWQELNFGTISGHGWMDRSEGAYENSQYTQGGVEANSTITFSRYLRSGIAGEFGLYGRGLHGAAHPDTRRDIRTGNLNGSLHYMLSQSITGQFGVEYGGFTMESDTGSTGLNTTLNNWIVGTGEFNALFNPVQISLNGRILTENLETDFINNVKTTFGSYGAEALFPVSTSISAIVGANYETVSRDTLDNVERISPYGRVNITPGNNIGLTLTAFTGYEYDTYMHRWELNPYVAHSAPLYPEEISWGASAEINMEMFPGFNLLGSVTQTSYENLYYWRYDDTNGFFQVENVNNSELVEFDAGVHFNPAPWVTMQASFETYLASFSDEDSVLANRNYYPFRPRVRIPAEMTITFPLDFQFTAEGELIGKRRVSMTSSQSLPVIGLLNLGLSKDFGEHITVEFNAVNILDDAYEYWLNYPEPGAQFYLGVRARF